MLLAFMATASANTTMSFNITQPNAAGVGFPGPFASETITVPTGGGDATITINGLTQGLYTYIIGDGNSFDFNFSQAVTLSNMAWVGGNANTALTDGGSGNVSQFGTFNKTINGFDGLNSAVSSFSFVAHGATPFLTAQGVLIPNSNGFIAAIHVFPTGSSCPAGGCATFLAGDGGGTVQAVTAEPGTFALIIGGLLYLFGRTKLERILKLIKFNRRSEPLTA